MCYSCGLLAGTADSCRPPDLGGVHITVKAYFLHHVSAQTLSFSDLFTVSLMNFSQLRFSGEAVCGVHRRKRAVHQVAAGERLGWDHLFCCWRKLQSGCEQDFMVLLLHEPLLFRITQMLPFPSFQIDLTEEMESWAAKNLISDDLMKVKPMWRDASFTLKYYSDALFDFPHWLGFSKRTFKVCL